MTEFFDLYRKKGFGETLETLFNIKEKKILQSEFFLILKKNKINLNSFFRAKKLLLDRKLIEFELTTVKTRQYKVICLTEKGIELCETIQKIQKVIDS